MSQKTTVSGYVLDKKQKALEGIQIISDKGEPQLVYSDENGYYHFQANVDDTLKIKVIYSPELQQKLQIIVKENHKIDKLIFNVEQQDQVDVIKTVEDPFEIDPLPMINVQNIPMGSTERYLALTTAAVSNNELTSNYNVRGGNYDENLVYVNGFNVYRPFLTRSGQQEGMSFINSALVNSIQFSAGGFNAEYGDKLSSVLDITYKTPTKLKASLMASLLGVEAHVEQALGSRFNYLVGARYRANGYLLNSLPAKGSYNPVFWDAQVLTNYALTEKLTWSLIGHFSSNSYQFQPETQETDFGTANEAYTFKVYFDGKENTRFQTMFGGTSLKWQVNKKTNLDFYATVFNTNEREYFDIQGQYYINLLETDPSKEEYGDSIAVLGVGTFLNHARNQLNATILNAYHNGSYEIKNGFYDDKHLKYRVFQLKWGVNFQQDHFNDILSEWKMIDSAGYSLPQTGNQITLYETIKGKLYLNAFRATSFLQWNAVWSIKKEAIPVEKKYTKKINREKQDFVLNDTIYGSVSKFSFTLGSRAGFTSYNNEFYGTPRITLKYSPIFFMVKDDKIVRRDISFHFGTGLYYQPPFYREFRTFDGHLNANVLAQKSFHVVMGTDVYFNMWDRKSPFKFTGEMYYKYLWNVNPYEVDNVRTRYYANNDAIAYAYGMDLNLHGEFIEGITSFFKIGIMRTREDILTDHYTEFYNAAGEKIIFGISEDQTVVDSAVIYPGYIPRPTDQLVNIGVLIQDEMPGFERLSVQMGLQYGSSLPYGPPDFDRYKDILRMKSYFRVDIGMSYDFLHEKINKKSFFAKHFEDAILSFEVFNLLGINNVLSKQWIQDVGGKYYAVPNYLTQRRFNLKMILRF